ncbi:MAG: flippase-like domain-containing protein [Actinomycetota bacterium]|nr:flippase-like domain-containing protein [Actinomycetota bacterium]
MERLKKNFILALVLGLAVYLVLAIVSGLEDLRDALSGFDFFLIPAILGLVSLSYAVRFVRWTYYLRLLKVRVPLRANAAIFAAGLSMTISPGKLGEVLKSVFIKDVAGTPVARTAPAVVAERATDGTGMVLWGLLGALAFSFGPWLLLLFLALTGVGIAVLRSRRFSLLAEKALRKLPLLDRLAPHVGDFHGASNELLAFRPLVVASGISFLGWGLECAAVYLCALGVGAEEPFLVVVFVFAVSSLAGAASMLPGGIGAAEAGMAGMFTAVAGLSGGLAVALTFIVRLTTLWFATLLGVAGLLLVRRVIGEPLDAAVTKAGTSPKP